MSFLCIRAEEFPTQTLFSIRPELKVLPAAVLERDPPLERVCSLNAKAFERGVRRGMTRTELDQISGIKALRRSLAEERSMSASILTLLKSFTPCIEDLSGNGVGCFVLDLAGTERLNGHPEISARNLQQQLKALGIEAALCISSDIESGLVLARTLGMDTKPFLIPEGQEAASLASLSCAALDPNAEHAEMLARWGIRTLGQLAAIPAAELVSRMGQGGRHLHALATGTHPHFFRPVEAEFSLQAEAAFEDAIELLDSLLFVLGPMLDRLILLATARALGLLSLTLTLQQERTANQVLSIRPGLPSTDRKFLLRLLQLELAAHPPLAAIRGLQLKAEYAPPTREQGGLFSPQLPDSSRLDVTLARIQSIVGEANVGSPQLRDTHAPDDFTVQPFHVRAATPVLQHLLSRGRIACRRFRPPWPACVAQSDARPASVICEHQRFLVNRAYGPWYSSGAWWGPDAWSREEWEVVLQAENAPVPLHALLIHDLKTMAWRVEGVYD